jgi:hypothetical protein
VGNETSEEPRQLKIEILKIGGLTTVYLPYNETGATRDREQLNLGAAAWLHERGLFSPKVIKLLNHVARGSGTDAATQAKALYYQMATTRGGRSNPLHKLAPGWSSLYHNGHGGITAHPKDICEALASVIADMHSYDALDISIIDGDQSESVTLPELSARTDIVMLAPPMPRSHYDRLRYDDGTDPHALRAEIASLKRERDELAADDHISRLCHTTADPLPVTAGQWQGGEAGSSSAPATPARITAPSTTARITAPSTTARNLR